MTLFNHRSLLTRTVAAATVGLRTCRSSPETKQSMSVPVSSEQPRESTTSASPTPEVSPGPSLSPSQNVSPGILKPNISHNNVIAEHAYLSEKAQMWVEGPSSAPEKITPFTLDDGLNHTDSMQTLNALKAGGVYGTFLVVGNPVSSTPETFKRETTEGCSIAVYSHIHNYNKFYPGRVGSLEATEDEYGKTKATPKEILGVDLKTNTWRCSGGHMN